MARATEEQKKRALARLTDMEIERRRREVFIRAIAMLELPAGWGKGMRELSEVRARSCFEKYPDQIKEIMRSHGYEPGYSIHYAIIEL